MSQQRPLTIREIQAKKKKLREAEQNKVRISNLSKLQMVPIQLYGKTSKKAIHQITVQIGPKQSVDVPESRVIKEQVENLRKRGFISVVKVGPGNVELNYKTFLNKKALTQHKSESKNNSGESNSNDKPASKPKSKKTTKKDSS